jgi:hypothetical protein
MDSIHYYPEIEKSNLAPFYIHIFRDGRDVALSFMKAPVGPKHIYFLAKKWKKEQQLSLKLKSEIDEKRFIEVRYEDLIHDPSSVIHSICVKLGIPYSDEVFEYFHSEESINTASSGRMWCNVTKPIMANNHNKFEREFSDAQLVIFERVAGDMLERLGYKTIHWPNVSQEEFTKDDIKSFEYEDKMLNEKVLVESEPEELDRRRPQEELLYWIKARKIAIA